jgi:hypothetical protein
VSHWLGHANPNTTLKIHAHVLGEAQDIAAIAHLNQVSTQPALDGTSDPGPRLEGHTSDGPSM